MLSLLLGATTYTFSLILGAFLIGLGIGSSVGDKAGRIVAVTGSPILSGRDSFEMVHKRRESGELLANKIAGRFVSELACHLVNPVHRRGNHDFGPIEDESFDEDHDLTEVVLGTRSAQKTGRCRLQEHRLAGKGLVRHA